MPENNKFQPPPANGSIRRVHFGGEEIIPPANPIAGSPTTVMDELDQSELHFAPITPDPVNNLQESSQESDSEALSWPTPVALAVLVPPLDIRNVSIPTPDRTDDHIPFAHVEILTNTPASDTDLPNAEFVNSTQTRQAVVIQVLQESWQEAASNANTGKKISK